MEEEIPRRHRSLREKRHPSSGNLRGDDQSSFCHKPWRKSRLASRSRPQRKHLLHLPTSTVRPFKTAIGWTRVTPLGSWATRGMLGRLRRIFILEYIDAEKALLTPSFIRPVPRGRPLTISADLHRLGSTMRLRYDGIRLRVALKIRVVP